MASELPSIMQKIFLGIFLSVAILYVLICGLLYFVQERLLFFPEKLLKDHRFPFDRSFKELYIPMKDGTRLHGLLFQAEHSKGLIFYLHGNGGSLARWGEVAKTYTDLHYDVFLLDYRGYGKSEGSLNGQTQFFDDIQTTYDLLKHSYPENKIVVLGYSIGTGPAAHLASTNHPALLILQAPYVNLADMMRHRVPFVPTFILRYRFETDQYLKQCSMPVIIFHGKEDEVIYYGSSLKLKETFKPKDTLITLNGQGHNGMTDNPDYKAAIARILSK